MKIIERTITVALLLGAIIWSVQPLLANWSENQLTAEQAEQDKMEILDAQDREERLAAAQEYNTITDTEVISDPWGNAGQSPALLVDPDADGDAGGGSTGEPGSVGGTGTGTDDGDSTDDGMGGQPRTPGMFGGEFADDRPPLPGSEAEKQDFAAAGSSAYRKMAGNPMAVLEVPRIKLKMTVRPGTDRATLRRGAGHMVGTSLPVGGPSTHSVLVGHSDMRSRVYFDRVRELKKGERFFVTSSAGRLEYEVDKISIVQPTDLKDIRIERGKDYVTLLTCIELRRGHHQKRYLVRGHRVNIGEGANDHPEAVAGESQEEAAPVLGVGAIMPMEASPAPADTTEAAPSTQPTDTAQTGDDAIDAGLDTDADPTYLFGHKLPFGLQQWMLTNMAIGGGATIMLLWSIRGWIRDDRKEREALREQVSAVQVEDL